jgi:phosphoglycerate kinase
MKIKSIKSAKNLQNKTILVRCDFDVPLKNKKILDNSRLQACIPTIEFLLKKKVKQIILIGHLGRPTGVDKKLSLEPVKKELEKLLKKDSRFKIQDLRISFYKNILDSKIQIPDSKIVMLENLRFHPRENLNCKKWAKKLANLADVYVNEAFAVSHRSASSVDAIQNYLPSYAGLHLEKEINNLSSVITKTKKPLTVIIGGAKIETKLPVVKEFISKADNILIGGGVANTFLKSQSVDIKKSLVNDKYLKDAKKLIKNLKIILPVDFKWSDNKIYDIGSKTIDQYSDIIKKSKTILWNGPMGYFEDKNFRIGTEKIAQTILKNKKAKIIIGGGETNEIFKRKKIPKNIFISTGGGAMLEFLSGNKMPGLRKIYK